MAILHDFPTRGLACPKFLVWRSLSLHEEIRYHSGFLCEGAGRACYLIVAFLSVHFLFGVLQVECFDSARGATATKNGYIVNVSDS